MFRLLLTISITLFAIKSFAQDIPGIRNAIVVRELANRSRLNEIKLSSCSNRHVVFEKNYFFSYDLMATIAQENPTSHKIMVRAAFGDIQALAPDSAVTDIVTPMFGTDCSKKNKPGTTNCKVYQSRDKLRLYVSMVNGENYEITWIFKNKKYYGRVIEKIGL